MLLTLSSQLYLLERPFLRGEFLRLEYRGLAVAGGERSLPLAGAGRGEQPALAGRVAGQRLRPARQLQHPQTCHQVLQ